MSTRCNVQIMHKDKLQYLYHHCDWYVSWVGLELYKTIKNYQSKNEKFEDYQRHYFLQKLPRSYEDTHCIHGDIEYLYKIENVDWKLKLYMKQVHYSFASQTQSFDKEWTELDKSTIMSWIKCYDMIEEPYLSHLINEIEAFDLPVEST